MSDEIKKAPASTVETGANGNNMPLLFDKDTISSLPRQQYRLLSFLLKTHHPVSVVDIIGALGQTDPRGHISSLRRRGYPIGDEWCKSKHSARYKRYFIRKEVPNGKE